MKPSVARKLAEEYVNVLKYNPELTHDERILSLELRLEQLVNDVEKGCAEVQKRQEVVAEEKSRSTMFLHPSVNWGEAIVSETPTEHEINFGQAIKQRSSSN